MSSIPNVPSFATLKAVAENSYAWLAGELKDGKTPQESRKSVFQLCEHVVIIHFPFSIPAL